MPFRYKDYCYETTAEIASALQGTTIIPGTAGYASYSACYPGTMTNSVTCAQQYKTNNTTAAATAAGQITFLMPTCTTVGPMTNDSGLSVPDVVEASWLVVLALVSAYSIKIWRRTL